MSWIITSLTRARYLEPPEPPFAIDSNYPIPVSTAMIAGDNRVYFLDQAGTVVAEIPSGGNITYRANKYGHAVGPANSTSGTDHIGSGDLVALNPANENLTLLAQFEKGSTASAFGKYIRLLDSASDLAYFAAHTSSTRFYFYWVEGTPGTAWQINDTNVAYGMTATIVASTKRYSTANSNADAVMWFDGVKVAEHLNANRYFRRLGAAPAALNQIIMPTDTATARSSGYFSQFLNAYHPVTEAEAQEYTADPWRWVYKLDRRSYIFLGAPASSSGIDISPGAGTLTLTGSQPGVLTTQNVEVGAGSLTLTGSQAGITQDTHINVGAGALVMTGSAVDVSAADGTVNVGTGALTLTGSQADVGHIANIEPSVGDLTLVGSSLDVENTGDVQPEPRRGGGIGKKRRRVQIGGRLYTIRTAAELERLLREHQMALEAQLEAAEDAGKPTKPIRRRLKIVERRIDQASTEAEAHMQALRRDDEELLTLWALL